MSNIHGKSVHFNYKFHYGKNTQVEIEVFGESLFTYYVGWELQNLVKVAGWANNECLKKLVEEEDNKGYMCHSLLIESRLFYFLAPSFFEIYVQSKEENHKMKIIFVHNRLQKITRALTESSHFLVGPEKSSFYIGKVYKTKDDSLAFSVLNRNGRTFTIIKGPLDLAIFCSRGIESWLTTYKVKKNVKKEIKKEN